MPARPPTGNRGTAALEFALVCPVLLLILGGLSDYALLIWAKNRLANGVAQAAQYAFITGINVKSADISSVVQNAASLPSAVVNTPTPVTACYCVTSAGSPAQVQTCGQPCSDQSIPGTYVSITATYEYQPLMPLLSAMTNPHISESAFVRLQ